jgi:hypothetical protein
MRNQIILLPRGARSVNFHQLASVTAGTRPPSCASLQLATGCFPRRTKLRMVGRRSSTRRGSVTGKFSSKWVCEGIISFLSWSLDLGVARYSPTTMDYEVDELVVYSHSHIRHIVYQNCFLGEKASPRFH